MGSRQNNTMKDPDRVPRVALLGATLGTGNLGVDALGAATVQGLVEVSPRIEILYQSWTTKPVDIRFGARHYRCEPLVIRRHSSMRRPDGVTQLRRLAAIRERLGSRLTGPLANMSTTFRRLRGCDLVLDISAGDSFADIYGEEVFWYQSQVKLLCLDLGVPLVLLPQTIGPFASESSRRVAADILRRATLIGTREESGADEVRRLCGKQAPLNLVQSPDLAIQLEPSATPLPDGAKKHLDENNGPLVAINVSGLLYFERRSFGLAAPHADVLLRLVRWALDQEGARVLLTPHVTPVAKPATVGKPTSDSTDNKACEDLLSRLTHDEMRRVDLLVGADHPSKAKHAMARCDFFVGARMHAFIGAASQHTPGAVLAYSKKARATCETIGAEDLVVDLRTLDAEAVVAAVDKLYRQRDQIRGRLEGTIEDAKRRIGAFFQSDLAPLLAMDATNGPRQTDIDAQLEDQPAAVS